MANEAILVFNFGGQYCHLISRRIRERGVYSEIVGSDIQLEELRRLRQRLDVKGIVLSGGPSSIYDAGAPRLDQRILEEGLPILGICYGHQLLAGYLGGKVVKAKRSEYGFSMVSIDSREGIFKGLSSQEEVWMSHGDTVLSVPEYLRATAHTDNCPIAAFSHERLPIFGIQWHAEVAHTKNGGKVLDNFILGICHAKKTWDAEKKIPEYVGEIKSAVGTSKAIIALSGGVDSSTAAMLASRALGDGLVAVFVDTGLMREGEADQIKRMAEKLRINLVTVMAEKQFMKALKGIADPEEKRKIVGREFINVFEKVAEETGAEYLIQGTIYPDRIESGHSKGSSVIKTHHNVGGIPENVKFKGIVEPLKDLYKDEVRKLALSLGMSKEMAYRQPFPGPGFAVRIIGEVTAKRAALLRKADSIVADELSKAGGIKDIWQSFAVLTGIRSTGVKGDARAYGEVIAIRAVESAEAMTANVARLPYRVLSSISARITGEIPEVVRVVYDITDKPPSTIEWE